MVDVFRALGCTVTADKQYKGVDAKCTTKHYNISLQIPLNFPVASKGKRKRHSN